MDSSPMRVNFDVLMILDALDRHGSFATAAESLYKTPAALSYMIQKLESDLNIVLLDRSGHRAKFTDTGRLMLKDHQNIKVYAHMKLSINLFSLLYLSAIIKASE